jgi:hypothetical protein
MFDLFKKRPLEVKELLAKIEEVASTLPPGLTATGQPLLSQLSVTVRNRWSKEHQDNYSQSIRSGEAHEAFIYNFLIQTIADKLESGRFHIFRGVLDDEGRTHKLLFEFAIDTMIENGEYTKQWADANIRAVVSRGIGSVG